MRYCFSFPLFCSNDIDLLFRQSIEQLSSSFFFPRVTHETMDHQSIFLMILTDCTSSNQLIGIAKEHIYILMIEKKERTICLFDIYLKHKNVV
jgi:hypothetical protein